MNWLRDNPVGVALVSISGALVLLALVMSVVWTMPVTVDEEATRAAAAGAQAAEVGARVKAPDLQALKAYNVINERPVFDESRQPELVAADGEDSSPEDESIAVRDAPKVRLTGVIITPGLRMASLTPIKNGEKSVRAHEGESLIGDYVGWQLAVVKPRSVVLESADGQSLTLELEVNDATIKEPPKPTPASNKDAQQSGKQAAADSGDGDQELSRAEQIRQRIAERREELRRQQEEQRAQQAGGANGGTTKYQDAVRAMMRNNSRKKSSEDDEEG